jgi:hypothetical protein
MKTLFILIILVSSIIMIFPIYPPAHRYVNYVYWNSHIGDYKCNCPENTACSCPVPTASICAQSYQENNPMFNQMCTISRWDGSYWIIQVTSILLSLIPMFAGIIVAFLYFRKQK